MTDLSNITTTGSILIFTGLAAFSLALSWWIFIRGKERARQARITIGIAALGLLLAAGGFLWSWYSMATLADEHDILAGVYGPYGLATGDEGGVIVWHRTATDFKTELSYARLNTAFPEMQLETYEAFLSANRNDAAVGETLGDYAGVQVMIVGPEEARRIRDENALPGLAQLGWLGIHAHSRPGFDADHTQALIYHETICGPGCGFGYMRFFHKVGDDWIEAGALQLWES